MTLTSNKKIHKLIVACLGLLFVLSGSSAFAQDSLTLSISPSLFDMSVNPGQEWRSSLRIINVNTYDLTVYLDVVNFVPQGESGDGQFLPVPVAGAGEGVTLAEWFSVTREAIVVPREQSLQVPFSVKVPFEASPGGHFAAILVGTRPPATDSGPAKVQTSQMVTSLFFARVAGDIIEQGSIREFITTDSFLGRPEATFDLRFENKGNVHLQPQGEIKITNMWGQERGIIPINRASQFGNVLPDSIRKFTFSWKGEWSFADIGRYTAEVTLAYGTEARQFTSAQTHFWVIPFKLLFGVFLGLALFAALITWFVKLYVRHMLVLAGIDINEYHKAKKQGLVIKKLSAERGTIMRAPVKAGLFDLRARLAQARSVFEYGQALVSFSIKYKLFFIAVAVVLLFVGSIVWYVHSANTGQRSYEISYVNTDTDVTLTSEEIIYNQLKSERKPSPKEINERLPKVKIINQSGVPGLGAEVKLDLESLGYDVTSLSADLASSRGRTVIVFNAGKETEALRLSSVLGNAPVATYEEGVNEEVITVFVGDDMESE